jgi:isoleucyl-tRNA synthetase
MFKAVNPKLDVPAMEENVLKFWKKQEVFKKTVEQRQGKPEYVFYEGPPTANGRPGVHHVLARVFKDMFPRYKIMRGYHVSRRGGWDTHGLPVEIEVEKQLGLHQQTADRRIRHREVQRTLPQNRSSPTFRTGRNSPTASPSGSISKMRTSPTPTITSNRSGGS